MTPTRRTLIAPALFCVGSVLVSPAQSRIGIMQLIPIAENPGDTLISIPFEYEQGLGTPPGVPSPRLITLDPLISLRISEQVNLFTTALVPASLTAQREGEGQRIDLGDVQVTLMVSPSRHRDLLWGVGPVVKLPTATIPERVTDRWGLGPSLFVMHHAAGDPWVYGIGVQHFWSIGPGHGPREDRLTIEPFLTYDLSEHLYLAASPEITAAWGRPPEDRWTVPVGGGIGTRVQFGKTILNLTISAYYNAIRAAEQSEWTLSLKLGWTICK